MRCFLKNKNSIVYRLFSRSGYLPVIAITEFPILRVKFRSTANQHTKNKHVSTGALF